MIPAKFTKLITELEYLTDNQVRFVEKLLKGTDSGNNSNSVSSAQVQRTLVGLHMVYAR